MDTIEQPMYEWNQIPWQKLERRMFKLQKRIYKASQRGDVKTLRRLQKLLMSSWSAKCIAVRRVTQDNQGKKTAGVDGVKSLTPKQRQNLIGEIKLGSKVCPTRRVWIPKPGREEKRPLGIPTMKDRALQALVKQALEPEWEARFEPNSYGFRPGRSCQDAVQAIYDAIRYKAKYVLDADIAKCFDCINHEALLKKLNTSPRTRRQIRSWLRAGVMDGKQLFPTFEGTPQGGVISPLLANIALHGMEERVKAHAETLEMRYPNGKKMPKRDKRTSLNLIRYADDFVILHENITVVQECKELISEWLKGIGLELKPSKTRIAHTLKQFERENPGLDFLGFNIKQVKVGKYRTDLNTKKEPLGFITLITPSKEKVQEHYKNLVEVINAHKAVPQSGLIKNLNPIIRGWANYYSTQVSKKTYSHLDFLVYWKLRYWAKRRHPQKTGKWITKKYWQSINGDNWVFATKLEGQNPLRLQKHDTTPIKRHVKVKGEASPYDGNLVYWSIRMGDHPEMPKRTASLLKKQNGKCAHCGMYFKDEDVIELDHKIPKSKGGKDSYENWQLLHRHCHDTKTALDGSYGKQSDCNSVKPKPPLNQNWYWKEDMLVMRCV
ncbi:group II intron reverse transcriptase/maturase [Microcoleus sp. F4-D5]|uniref:group II intron reverse transcriptase/maturase n=1 Tax=Microcoleus sp. F4-D5 TaxID=2818760 RepID=UPI002FD6163B